MCTTPAANSAKAAPRRHSLRVVFLAVRRRASHLCLRMRSVPTAPSLRRSHFGRDFEGELIATLVPDGLWWRSQGILGGVEGGQIRPNAADLHFPPRPPRRAGRRPDDVMAGPIRHPRSSFLPRISANRPCLVRSGNVRSSAAPFVYTEALVMAHGFNSGGSSPKSPARAAPRISYH